MKRSSLAVVGSVCLALVVTSCASYNASALSNLAPMLVQSKQATNGDIVVLAKAFDKGECKKHLDRDVLAVGYQPVQLYIQNNSDKAVIFSVNGISLPCASAEEVAKKVHTSTVGRVAAYGLGSLFLWPLVIPAVVDGLKSSEANDALDADFAYKVAGNQTIFPQTYFNKIIFVPSRDYQPCFSVTLLDGELHQPKVMKITAM